MKKCASCLLCFFSSLCTQSHSTILQLAFVAMVKKGSEMMVLRLVRASVQIFLLPSSCLFSASSLLQIEDTWAANKLPAVFCLRFTPCKVLIAISYLSQVKAAIKALITATSDFPKRNSTTEESASEFSLCAWFIHEGEQSNQMRISPKW